MSHDGDTDKVKKERSPSFPFISLPKAIERLRTLHANHRFQPARVISIATSWGYALKSSGLLQTVAALKQYGLIEDAGSGGERKIQITDLGRRILQDERLGAREAALKEAARNPRLIAEYLPHWVPVRPSDSHCISELQLDRGFTEIATKAFLHIFDDTVSFANLKNDDSLSSSQENAQQDKAPMEANTQAGSAPPANDRGPPPVPDRAAPARRPPTILR